MGGNLLRLDNTESESALHGNQLSLFCSVKAQLNLTNKKTLSMQLFIEEETCYGSLSITITCLLAIFY